MRIIIIITLFLSYCSACRRADTYPEYKPLIGKYKLVYIKESNLSWPLDSFYRITPADLYEIEFRKLSKVRLYKNGNCEKSMKVYSCKMNVYNSTYPSVNYDMNIDKTDYTFQFPYYQSINSITDTLVATFYPFDFSNTENGNYYSCYYLKE